MSLPADIKRILLPHAVAAGVAGVVSLSVSFYAAHRCNEISALPFDNQEHRLPPEMICLVPYTADYRASVALESSLPIVRLREYEPGRYELLYWGNPVRPRYAFSIRNLMTGEHVLTAADSADKGLLPLPVTEPRRRDRKLPLQPIVKLSNIKGREGDLYAARVSVHDADKGTVLCSAVYIISGSESR